MTGQRALSEARDRFHAQVLGALWREEPTDGQRERRGADIAEALKKQKSLSSSNKGCWKQSTSRIEVVQSKKSFTRKGSAYFEELVRRNSIGSERDSC